MTEVRIREVGPRDGLQAESPVPVEARVELIRRLAAAGLSTIEAVSFVSEKAVPAMGGAAEVLAGVGDLEGVTVFALVPNVKGAERARVAGIDHLTVTVSASAAYNEKNVRMTIDESLASVAAIRDLLGVEPFIDAVVSCAFGSPYEGDIAPADVAALGVRLMNAGASALTFADTTGMATPRRIAELVAATGSRIGLHLHETRGTAMVNAYAALDLGVRDFDTSIGGLGGSPFAAGAGGNLATEDFVHLLDDLGIATGVDLARLLEVSAWLGDVIGRPVPSKVAHAGPRSRLAPA
jgi:hydroxymethylglutaryl-CoA lyase